MKYVLIDKENDQAFGSFDSEYDAAIYAIDKMKTFGEISRREARELRDDANRNGTRYQEFGTGRLEQSWQVLELTEVGDELIEVK